MMPRFYLADVVRDRITSIAYVDEKQINRDKNGSEKSLSFWEGHAAN